MPLAILLCAAIAGLSWRHAGRTAGPRRWLAVLVGTLAAVAALAGVAIILWGAGVL